MESQLRPLRPLVRAIVKGSDAVTAISSHTAGLLRRLSPGVQVALVPFGAAVSSPPRAASPPPPPPDPHPFTVLFVGRLVQRKGVHVLLEALARLDPGLGVRLRVVGDGPERERLRGQAAELGLDQRVELLGFVPAEQLEAELSGCDALVLPAVVDAKGDVEGLGVVLLEAMSFGKPVVASRAGGITDIVRDGENGLLVPPGDTGALGAALARLAGDPGLARSLGEAGAEDVRERFSWDSILDRLLAVYQGVLHA